MKQLLPTLISFSIFALTACGGGETPKDNNGKPSGSAVFNKFCTACHGSDGKLGASGSKDLTLSTLDREGVIEMIKKGSSNRVMMAYENLLKPDEVEAVADFVISLRDSSEKH